MENLRFKSVVKTLVFMCAMLVVTSAVVMVLWNFLLPKIFDLPALNLFEAMGLLLLTRLLTGSLKGSIGAIKGNVSSSNEFENARETWKNEWRSRCQSHDWNSKIEKKSDRASEKQTSKKSEYSEQDQI
jgi:hypothetical protein